MNKNKGASLWGYIKCCSSGNDINSLNRTVRWQDTYIAIFSAILYIILLGTFGNDSMPLSLPLSEVMIMVLSITAYQICQKPSLFNLMPISTGKKTAYFFIYLLFMTAVVSVLLAVVSVVFMLIVSLIVLVASGEWIFVIEETKGPILSPCANGYVLAVAIFLFAFGLIFIIAFIKRRWLRNLLMFSPSVILFIALEVFTDVSHIARNRLYVDIGTVPNSWIFVMIMCICGGIAFIAGLVRFILYMRTKNY